MKENLRKIWREHKMLLALSCAVILMQTVVGVLLWDRLPDTIARHFNFNNEPDGYSSKAFVVFGMPLVLVGLHLMCVVLSCTPGNRTDNLSPKVQRLLLLVVPAVSLLTMTLSYGNALGAPFAIDRMVWGFVGALFALIGNYLPKLRRNYTTGIKLPWTLADDEIWNRTHRFAAPVWVVCGLLMVVCALIGSGPEIPVAAITAVIVLPTVYSLVINWKKYRK